LSDGSVIDQLPLPLPLPLPLLQLSPLLAERVSESVSSVFSQKRIRCSD
jgi:hypothetical protein